MITQGNIICSFRHLANALENIGVIKKDLSCLCIITDEIDPIFTSFEYQVLLPYM